MSTRCEKQSPRVVVVRPDRVRLLGKAGFGWIDARLHRQGWLELMAPTELAVYSFLCLVANRQGVSWYRRGRISQTLAICESELRAALKRLCELDLVAYQPFRRSAADGFHQVLSLPEGGPRSLSDELEPLSVRST